MNKVFLIGNLTTDVDKQTTQSGVSVAKFGLAVSRRFANKDSQDNTDFFNIVCWRQQADFAANYLSKGKKASIVGSIQVRKYQAQDGSNRTAVDIIADEIEILSPRDGQGTEATGSAQEANPAPRARKELVEEETSGDLPF